MDAERQRLAEDAARTVNWKRWGTYLAERQWGTVREDYSGAGNAWDFFHRDHAPLRAYRWGEDGLLGFTDRQCRLCLAPALWNGRDPILKERLFGLANSEGNHGEDVKECYYYLDSTPTHSYARGLYKYPQAAFPYARLLEENARRGLDDPEFEIEDTGVFDEDRYFDVWVEYAKAGPDDLLMRVRVENAGPEAAAAHVLSTLWFRNTWSWGCRHEGCSLRPWMRREADGSVLLSHENVSDEPGQDLGRFRARAAGPGGSAARWLFTENETNRERMGWGSNPSPWVKDAFHRCVVEGEAGAVNPELRGTKAAAWFHAEVPAGGAVEFRLRLAREAGPGEDAGGPDGAGAWLGADFERVFEARRAEADAFFGRLFEREASAERVQVRRQAYAGLLWSKQFYHYVVDDWLEGDRGEAPPPAARKRGRNREWRHVFARDVLSMPDKWEYPWFAAWDLAFHTLALADVDPEFAKEQILLLLREWYMHPNGQMPAYEWNFSDVNPPVHAWAAWRVYKIAGRRGGRDREFLKRVFSKLVMNFTWWVNRKDAEGNNLFAGGFLGLDNIGIFDRSAPLPTGGSLEQADGTAWMAFYALTMMAMAMELAVEPGGGRDSSCEDMASKFFEHFVQIVDAINAMGGSGLWDEEDGFYYDRIRLDYVKVPLKTRSLVGLLPLIAVEVLARETVDRLPEFKKRMEWFVRHRGDLARHISFCNLDCPVGRHRMLLAIPSRERLERLLRFVFDESEFLGPYGIRSVSRVHEAKPFVLYAAGREHRVEYVPGEGNSRLFGGNSNWRGPVWIPVNYLIAEALERYHHFYGDSVTVALPGHGRRVNLREAAGELWRRMDGLFMPGAGEGRPCHGGARRYAEDPRWKNLVLFHEYFHADTGRGCGASHQTGWTGLVARE